MSSRPPFRRPNSHRTLSPAATTNSYNYNYNHNYKAVGYTYVTPIHNHPNNNNNNNSNNMIGNMYNYNYNALGHTYRTAHHNYRYNNNDPHHSYPNNRHVGGGGGGGLGARAAPPYPAHRPKHADFRAWEFAKDPPPPNAERFVVLSYNILADNLANSHRKLYFHIPRLFMSWKWRKANILFELKLWSADIMCFQEVDKFQELEEDLMVRGYSGIWKMRTGEPVDGCALFFRTTRFKLVFEDCIEFNKHGMRDNVAQICVLESLTWDNNGSQLSSSLGSSVPNRVVVCNIHVLYNPRRGEMKLGQVRMLLEKAQAVSKTWDDAPIVLCGDFNCTPESPLYNFISQQKLDISQVDRDKVSGQASAEIHSPSRSYSHHSRGQPAGNIANSLTTSNDILEKNKNDNDKLNSQLDDNSCSSSPESVKVNSMIVSSLTSDLSSQSVDGLNMSSAFNCDKMGEKLNGLSITEINESLGDNKNLVEDREDILPMLHSGEDVSPSNFGEVVFKTDITLPDKPIYNPSLWTAMEIATATGNTNNTIPEHTLKLRSTYSEVVDSSGTRDQYGEPLVTSYNCCFMGTVDYIWRSEGLQTVKALALIRKDVMQQCGGFPTKKWGSDHIALVSELAFIKYSGDIAET